MKTAQKSKDKMMVKHQEKDRMDEHLGMKYRGKHMQSMKDRRDEMEGMVKTGMDMVKKGMHMLKKGMKK